MPEPQSVPTDRQRDQHIGDVLDEPELPIFEEDDDPDDFDDEDEDDDGFY